MEESRNGSENKLVILDNLILVRKKRNASSCKAKNVEESMEGNGENQTELESDHLTCFYVHHVEWIDDT